MKLTIESINDDQHGPCFHFYGEADTEGLHGFTGIETNLNAAFEAAKQCIRTELNHFGLTSQLDVLIEPGGDEQ